MAKAATHHLSPHKDALRKRLRRIEGQVRGVEGMVDSDRDCIDVITQLSAIQAALDQVALELLDGHVEHCLGERGSGEQRREELMGAVRRLLRHG